MKRRNKITLLHANEAGIIEPVKIDVRKGGSRPTIDDLRQVILDFTDILMEWSAIGLEEFSKKPRMDDLIQSFELIHEVCEEIRNIVNDPSFNRKGAVIDDNFLEHIYLLAIMCIFIGQCRQLLDLIGVLSKEQLQREILQMTKEGQAGLAEFKKTVAAVAAEVKETVAAGAAEAAADRGKKHKDTQGKLDEIKRHTAGVPAMVEREVDGCERRRHEIRVIAKRAELSPKQLQMVTLWEKFGNMTKISKMMNISRKTAYEWRKAIIAKYNDKGLYNPFLMRPTIREAERQRQEDERERQEQEREQHIEEVWDQDN
ncbi:MAG TPA: hypothetical protein PKY10_06295 [Lentisphaeria bacterium]|nr:hypothetical protein [Lentisphaeria bacterium]